MQNWKNAKEPFDLKLFVYHCVRGLPFICLGALLGLLLIGGGYYLGKVALAAPAPYQVVDKYYVEYGTDPQILNTYSYFAGYTWDDWIKSDEWVEPVLGKLSFPMTKEELVDSLSAEIKSDVRIPYITVTHEEADKAEEIAYAYEQAMLSFGSTQKELISIRLIDTEGPLPEARDIRVLRACILGLAVGAFLVWFMIGFYYILDGKVYVPETFTYRYGIPAAGFVNRRGEASGDLSANLDYLLRGKNRIGITAVDGGVDLKAVEKLLPRREYTCISSPLQVAESGDILRGTDGNLLLVQAGRDVGGAIDALLHLCKVQDVPVTAAVLVNVDQKLVAYYRFSIVGKSRNGGKFESKLSNIELMSAKADKGCKNDITVVGGSNEQGAGGIGGGNAD